MQPTNGLIRYQCDSLSIRIYMHIGGHNTCKERSLAGQLFAHNGYQLVKVMNLIHDTTSVKSSVCNAVKSAFSVWERIHFSPLHCSDDEVYLRDVPPHLQKKGSTVSQNH